MKRGEFWEVNIFRTVTVKIKRVVLLLLFQFRLTESANFTQENEEQKEVRGGRIIRRRRAKFQ